MLKYTPMFTRLCVLFLLAAVAARPASAQLASALPADRLAFANQLAKRGLYAEALKEYEAIRNEPSVPQDEVRFRLGEAYRRVGRAADALAVYSDLIRDAPQSRFVDFARLNRALLLDGDARMKELAALNHAGASAQIRATALYWLGETAEAKKDAKGAVAWYEKAAEVARTNDVARLSRLRAAALLSASGDAKDRRRAQVLYLDLSAEGDRGVAEEAVFFAGMLSYREGRYEEAAKLFRRLVRDFTGTPRARECRVYAAWANYLSGRYTEALELAAPLREEGDEDAHYLVAASLRMLERRGDAVDAYTRALEKFPRGRHADTEWFERLATLAASAQHRRVLDELSRRPDPPEKVSARAWSYGCEAAIAVTNFPRAIEYARLVARRRDGKTAPSAAHRLAWLYEKTGDWTRAATSYRWLAQNWPTNAVAPQAYYLAGVAETRAGRGEQACADWTALLAAHPNSPYAREALYARAMEELRRKEFRAAERSLAELLTRFPDTPKKAEALYWRGVCANAVGDAPEAERHFRASLAARPSAEFAREAKLELASVLQKNGHDAEAASLFAGLLETKAVDRLPPDRLAWVAETLLASTNYTAALAAAKVIEARRAAPDWDQIGAALAGAAYEGLDEGDAASAAYARALAADAKTARGALAALALGKIETAKGLFDEAKAHLSDAVQRADSRDLLLVRVQAYAALAENEEERGDLRAALGYHLLVGTLFDDAEVVPRALARAEAILRKQGKTKEADDLAAERAKRYPKAAKE